VAYDPVSGKLKDIVTATVESLMTKVTRGSVFRLWVLAMAGGSDFHLSFIPEDFKFETHTLQFEPEEAAALFELGYRQSVEGTAWATQLAPDDAEDILDLIRDPVTSFDIPERYRILLKRGAN
jgi:hypothetical protein